ncbi:MAG: T9SS type A sorting domain-containing protein [Bacteroidota bacterium]
MNFRYRDILISILSMKKNLFILFSIVYTFSFAQQIIRDTSISIKTQNFMSSFSMNGYLDGENTLTRNPYTKVFEPMMYVKMTNTGTKKIIHPRLVFNNKSRWFTIDLMRAECFDDAVTEKDKSLSVWKFFRDNRVHDSGPELTDNINDPMKLLGVYGYGLCYNTNYSMCFLSRPYLASRYKWYSPQGLHGASEMNFGTRYVFLDSDIETFYLKNDNVTLAGSQEIFSDRHLVRRTHHYGKQYNFLPDINNYIANLFYKYDQSYFFGYIAESKFHSIDFNLRPGESLIYDWTLPIQEHTDNLLPAPNNFLIRKNNPNSLTENEPEFFRNMLLRNTEKNNMLLLRNTKDVVIANGMFDFKMNFVTTSLSEIFDYHFNIAVRDSGNNGPNLHLENITQPGEAIIKVTSPFVIVDGYVKGHYVRSSSSDSIKIFWSHDSISWIKAGDVLDTGNVEDSIALASFINSSTSALYKYYIRFLLSSSDSAKSCGIDSLEIHTQFQASKFFLPALVLGTNTIEYSDANTDSTNIVLEIKWKETTENIPPDKIMIPVFPQDSSIVNNLKFTFIWTIPTDNDGDDIVNYEFQLSDRADMKFPLSSTFEVYVSNTDNNTVSPTFTIPKYGLLNDSTTYYWRVRAKDSRGAWGQWSNVWSFIPKGVMPPVNATIAITNDSIYITWQQNNGEQPAYYEIHASNEWMGFSPDSLTYMDTTSQTNIIFPVDETNKLFYRIIAVASNGEKSGSSELLELPYPLLLTKIDTVKPNTTYSINIKPTAFYYSRVTPVTYTIATRQDSVSTTVLSMPQWISLLHNDTLSSFVDSSVAFQITVDSLMRKVSLKYNSAVTNATNILTRQLSSTYINSLPAISDITSTVVAGISYRDTIFISDKDIPYNDSLIIVVKNHPVWMNISNYQNNIILSGTPEFADIGDTVIIVSVTDRTNSTQIKNYVINILPLVVSFIYNGSECSSLVSLTDSSVAMPGDSIILWDWNFGDGDTSTLQNPNHHSDSTAIYIVTLNANSSSGCSGTFTDTITILISTVIVPLLDVNNKITIFPNPTNSSFTILLKSEMTHGVLQMYNSIGQIIYSEQLITSNEMEKEIDAEQLSQGIYYIFIHTPEKQWKARIQKIK